MSAMHIAGLLIVAALVASGGTPAAAQDCRVLIAQRESQCQAIAEKRAGVCPDGQAAAEGEKKAECMRLSTQLRDLCTRKPCGAAPSKKAKRKAARTSKAKASKTKAGKTKRKAPKRSAGKSQ